MIQAHGHWVLNSSFSSLCLIVRVGFISKVLVVLEKTNTDAKMQKGTATIVGDSIMSGIREKLLKKDKHSVKVRFFSYGTIEDMEVNIKPILK